MILAFEMTWTGTMHAPGNGATLQTIAAGFPDQDVRVFAEDTHLRELAANRSLIRLGRVSFHPVTVSPRHRSRTHLVSWRRFWTEFSTVREALAAVPREEPCLLMLISATSTAVFAACLAARLRGGRTGVQVGMHGNLNEITGWRPRNPFRRSLDLQAAMGSGLTRDARFLVLEPAIRDELVRLRPALAGRVDVLPLPINDAEIEAASDVAVLAEPVCFGFVGQATEAKGIDIFLRLAARATQLFGDRVAFMVIGRAPPGSDPARFAGLAAAVGTEHLSRAEFIARLARVHYVLLPFRTGYYDLAASGALIDAVTWARPVIATRVGFVEALFAAHGDVGWLCDDEAGLEAAIAAIAASPDPARYAGQQEALGRARDGRRHSVPAIAGWWRLAFPGCWLQKIQEIETGLAPGDPSGLSATHAG